MKRSRTKFTNKKGCRMHGNNIQSRRTAQCCVLATWPLSHMRKWPELATNSSISIGQCLRYVGCNYSPVSSLAYHSSRPPRSKHLLMVEIVEINDIEDLSQYRMLWNSLFAGTPNA